MSDFFPQHCIYAKILLLTKKKLNNVSFTACARITESNDTVMAETREIVLRLIRWYSDFICSDGMLSFWSKVIT